jgi:hypothetical protein
VLAHKASRADARVMNSAADGLGHCALACGVRDKRPQALLLATTNRTPDMSRDTTNGIAPFISKQVHNVASAKSYITDLVAHGCDFHLNDDPKELVPQLFNSDEALILAARVERLRDYLKDPIAYLNIARARKAWADSDDAAIASEFRLFGQSPGTRSEELSDADMVALLERYSPGGAYEEMGSDQLMELMNYFGSLECK